MNVAENKSSMDTTTRLPFFFKKRMSLSVREMEYCRECARAALQIVSKRQFRLRSFWNGYRESKYLGGLAMYALFLRKIASGQLIRYSSIFHPAGISAARLGHRRILAILLRNGVALDALKWYDLNVLNAAVISHQDDLAEELFNAFPQLARIAQPYDSIAYAAMYGTVRSFRQFACRGMRVDRAYGNGGDKGTPFILAVAYCNIGVQKEILKHGKIGEWNVKVNIPGFQCDTNLISLALDADNYDVAKLCVTKGWLPSNIASIYGYSHARESIVRFKFLCRHFPKIEWRKLVAEDIKHSFFISPDVLKYCGIATDGKPEKAVDDDGNPIWGKVPEKTSDLKWYLAFHPEEVMRLYPCISEKLREAFVHPDNGLEGVCLYCLRLAREKGIALIPDDDGKRMMLRNLSDWAYAEFRPHLRELGMKPVKRRKKEDHVTFSRKANRDQSNLNPCVSAIKLRGNALTRVLDREDANPNFELSYIPFSCHLGNTSPKTFEMWVMRGLEPYALGIEGEHVMEFAGAQLIPYLVNTFAMTTRFMDFAGNTVMENAAWHGDLDRVRLLVEGGCGPNFRRNDHESPLRTALFHGHDDVACYLYEHGGQNIDAHGVRHPVPQYIKRSKTRRISQMKSDSVRKDRAASRVRVPVKVKERLQRLADKYEQDFPRNDPRETIPKEGDAENKEATAFVAACLSFGAIEQFKPKIEQLINYAGKDMDGWIRNGRFLDTIPDDASRKFYRFVTYANLRAFLCAYRRLMRARAHDTLGKYVKRTGDGTGLGAVNAICKAFADSDVGYLVPSGTSSACKRLCLFLRWMVRKQPVDIGLWADFIDRKTLIMPLDVHVLKQARKLRLLAKESTTMATAHKLTALMSEVFPGDPLRGDIALYGLGRSESDN